MMQLGNVLNILQVYVII